MVHGCSWDHLNQVQDKSKSVQFQDESKLGSRPSQQQDQSDKKCANSIVLLLSFSSKSTVI